MASKVTGKVFQRVLRSETSTSSRSRCIPSQRSLYIPADTSTRIRAHTKLSTGRLQGIQQAQRNVSYTPRGSGSFYTVLRKIWSDSPVMFPIGVLAALSGLGAMTYTVYYLNRQDQVLSAFPEPVAKHLRRALYYTNQSSNPKKALEEYQKALFVADDLKMDPFSPEMLGLKTHIASFFEKLGVLPKAIEILEQLRADCLKWIEWFGDKPENELRRNELMSMSIRLSVTLGRYYLLPSIDQREAAEQMMTWGVTAVLKENRRVREMHSDVGSMGEDESGAVLEALAEYYVSTSRRHLAAPLYLEAMSTLPPDSCHTVTLMNNLAVALALQNPPPDPGQPSPSAADQILSGRSWANKALALAASIRPPARTEECDRGCAVATTNLGDFAVLEGDVEEAKRRWQEGLSLSKAIGFQEGEKATTERLKASTSPTNQAGA